MNPIDPNDNKESGRNNNGGGHGREHLDPPYESVEEFERYFRQQNYNLDFAYMRFKDLELDVQLEIIKQLDKLRDYNPDYIYVPKVDQYTNPYAIYYFHNSHNSFLCIVYVC